MKKEGKLKRFFKGFLEELAGSILFEVILNILLFIPRMFIRLLKNVW